MSSKGSKRRHRRINTHEEEQPEKKLEEIIEQSDDSKSNISTDTDKLEKDTSVKEENGENKTTKDVETPVQNGKDTTASVKEIIETKTVSAETVNGRADSEITTSQSTTDSSETQKSIVTDASSDLEPLVLDSEDTELQFPSETGSDRSSEIDKSPVLTRCQTRRSQTRNLPTPKTPKALDFNGGEAECKSEIRVNITRLATAPEVVVTPATDSEENTMEPLSFDVRGEKSEDVADDGEESEDDLTNASVFVNYTGNDTTRNFDITTTSTADDGPTGPSFLEAAKDMSYGETLRGISGRRALRHHVETYRPRLYKSTVDLTSKDLADGIKKFTPLTPAPSGGTKRKLLNRDSPEEFKRVKTDGDGGSSGLLSYIPSPFKSKLGRTEIPSSTPKLTSYKYTAHQGTTIIDEVSKIDLELHTDRPNNTTEPKKWCSIM